MTQIEAKALELYPDVDKRADFYQEYQRETELERAAYIKGYTAALSDGWIDTTDSNPEITGQYEVVYKGPHKELVTTAYYCSGDGWDTYKSNNYHVVRWRKIAVAATPSPVSREEAEQWAQQNFPIEVEPVYNKVGEHINNMDLNQVAREAIYEFYDHLASLSPAQPGYNREQVEEAISLAQEMTDWAVSFKHTTDEIIKQLNP